jgi:hypothetical protein
MALKAYTLDLALQTSSEFAIGNTIPSVAGIATDGEGFIPTKNSINKTITLSKGFGKFGGRLFELTEQTVYSWDAGSTDADAYLVIDLTKQNSFTGTIEDGTYTFVDNQSSIVISSTQPEPSANTLVYKLDGNYQTENSRSVSDLAVLGNASFSGTASQTQLARATYNFSTMTITFIETQFGVQVLLDGNVGVTASAGTPSWTTHGSFSSSITAPRVATEVSIPFNSGIQNVTTNSPFVLEIQFTPARQVQYRARNLRDNDTTSRIVTAYGTASAFWIK